MDKLEDSVEKWRKDVGELNRRLQEERSTGKDVYNIARTLQQLKGRGVDVPLDAGEVNEIKEHLETARQGMRGGPLSVLPPGYALARWLLVLRTLGHEIPVTSSDEKMIQETVNEYISQGNIDQLASLVHTAEIIGAHVNLERLTDQGYQELRRKREMIR